MEYATMNARSKAPAVSPSKVVYTEVPPNPKRLVTALREMGYTSLDAVLDLMDNSIDAGATRIDVTIREGHKGRIGTIDIVDNGRGMDKATLNQALRFGSDTEHDTSVDLGKYGMGLNSAGISIARNIWVMTRQNKGQGWEATFDLGVIERENRFVIVLHEATGPRVVDTLGDQGTLVRLSQIDRISDGNPSRFADKLRTKIGQVYRHFIAAGVRITVNKRVVAADDPLMLDHELTRVKMDTDIELAPGKVAHLKVVELPDLGQHAEKEADILPSTSGIYVVRNGRQIMDAQTFDFYKHHHSYSHFRAELSFDGTLDSDFHVDVKKGAIIPDERMLEKLEARLRPLIIETAKPGDRGAVEPARKVSHSAAEDRLAARFSTPAKQPAKTAPAEPPAKYVQFEQAPLKLDGRFFSVKTQDGRYIVTYDEHHPFYRHVSNQPGAVPVVDAIVYALAKADPKGEVTDRLSDLLRIAFS